MDQGGSGDLTIVAEGVLARLRSVYESLSEAEQRVAAFIADAPDQIVYLPVKALAERIGVSEATVIRCCRSLGYRGLRDLKLALAAETVTPIQVTREQVAPTDSVAEITRKILHSDIQAIADTLAVIDPDALEQAVAAMLTASKIEFYGIGSSIPVAMDAAYRFLRIGVPSAVVTDPYMQMIAAAQLPSDAVAFAISHSGHSTDIINALRAAHDTGATRILLTSHANAPLNSYADIRLVTAARATMMLHGETLASRIAHMSVIDALNVAVSVRQLDKTLDVMTRASVFISERF